MSFAVTCLKALNKLFPLPKHPFNMQTNGELSYAMWQYQKGEQTVKFYLDFATLQEMFRDKQVLDVGCGAAGKSLYYLSLGAQAVTGVDVVAHYQQESEDLARELGLEGFQFVLADAAKLPFADNSFDTAIMNDAMEHVSQPLAVLQELYRVLRPGGRIYVNFPPYNHPFGAHLSDAIGIPWVHVLFSDKTLITAYKELVADLPDGQSRIDFRISKDETGREYFSYINKISIKRFNSLVAQTNFKKAFYNEVPLRKYFAPLAKLPFCRDFFVKMVVCVLEKEA